jgi:hypothetical protein
MFNVVCQQAATVDRVFFCFFIVDGPLTRQAATVGRVFFAFLLLTGRLLGGPLDKT